MDQAEAVLMVLMLPQAMPEELEGETEVVAERQDRLPKEVLLLMVSLAFL